MPVEPAVKRAIAFFDGQNLFHAAKDAFGYTFPNYDPIALAEAVCAGQGWELTQVRFYTGVPDKEDNGFWNHFWNRKLAVLGTRKNVFTFARHLRYRNKTVRLPDGSTFSYLVGQEKGIDVRIALDLVRLARQGHYDVGLIFSQDQDLTEAVKDVKDLTRSGGAWIKLACAFPVSPTSRNRRGVDKTDWIRIDRSTYDKCIDPLDHRPKRPGRGRRPID